MNPVNELVKAGPVPERLAPSFAIRPPIEYRLTQLFDVCRSLTVMFGKPGTVAIDFAELVAMFKDIEAYLLSRIPKLPCECIDATKCEVCQGKEWVTLEDLRRIGSTLPRKSEWRSFVERATPEEREKVRAQRRKWWNAHGKEWTNSQSASKRLASAQKRSQKRAQAASSKSADESKAANGPSATDGTKPISGSP
jgi:hypothetical protein